MWYRLKSSLISALIATVIVTGLMGLAEPSGQVSAARAEARFLASLDNDERLALAIAVRLAALAVDAAVEEKNERSASTREASRRTLELRSERLRALRMPFYSFAARPARSRES